MLPLAAGAPTLIASAAPLLPPQPVAPWLGDALVWLALGGAATIVVLGCGLRLLAVSPVAPLLARSFGVTRELSGSDKTRLALFVAAWLPVAFVGPIVYGPRGMYAGYTAVALLIGASAIAAWFLRKHRRVLRAAARAANSAVPLAHAQSKGHQVALAVRVARDAPVSAGALSAQTYAWWQLTVDGVREPRTGARSPEPGAAARRWRVMASTPRVPIADNSGQGWLDLGRATLDFRALRQIRRDNTRAGTRLLYEESVLTPGEELYVFGRITEIAPAAAAIYRDNAVCPTIGGSDAQPLLAYAGGKGALMAGIRRELVAAAAVFCAGAALNIGVVLLALRAAQL